MGFLIDTCIWVDVERGALAPADVANFTGMDAVYLSPVTIAELKFGVDNTSDPNIRQKRQAALHRLKRKPILCIDGTTGEIFGSLAAQMKAIVLTCIINSYMIYFWAGGKNYAQRLSHSTVL